MITRFELTNFDKIILRLSATLPIDHWQIKIVENETCYFYGYKIGCQLTNRWLANQNSSKRNLLFSFPIHE